MEQNRVNPYMGIADVAQAEQILTRFRNENRDDYEAIQDLLNELLNALFASKSQLCGDADDFHNFSVSISKISNDNRSAYSIVKEGLKIHNVNTDLLADALLYGSSCGEKEECQTWYTTLQSIDKSRWTWRAFTFSIDYLLDIQGSTPENNFSTDDILTLAKAYQTTKPDKEDAWLATYNIYRRTNQQDKALAVLEEAINKFDYCPKCCLRYADAMIEYGKYKEALPVINKMLRHPMTTEAVNTSYMFFLDGQCKLALLWGSPDFEKGIIDEDKVNSIYKSFRLARDSEGISESVERRIDAYINRLSIETDVPFE